MQNIWNIVQLITKQKKASAQWIAKLLKSILTLSSLFEKMQKKFKIVQQMTKRNKLYAQPIVKFLRGF